MNPNDPNQVTYFAETDTRNKRIPFGIKAEDRSRHVYVIGKTGMGKSTLLENMAVQDIKNGNGFAFIDPHGKTAELLLEYIPEERKKDVIYFAPFDIEYPISFNVLESVDPDKRHLVVSGLMSTFKKIWQDAWSARMEYILTNTLLALLEYPGATLLGVNRMLSEKQFRNDVISHITDVSVRNFWTQEFANYTERMAAEAVPAIQNKIGQFTANPLIRNMIGQSRSSFDIRKVMDSRKIVLINLSKGRIGESNANLLGGMLITKIYLGAMSRADLTDSELKKKAPFYLFVDEFQNFANESFADILSEARKYKLSLTIAHQYVEQMEEEVRSAVFGNVGSMIVFRVGAFDAEVLEKEFSPVFLAEDIVNLGIFQIYLKLMIDKVTSQPFSATTLGPIPQPDKTIRDEVVALSRAQFATTRAEIEKEIVEWHESMPTSGKNDKDKKGNISNRPISSFNQSGQKPSSFGSKIASVTSGIVGTKLFGSSQESKAVQTAKQDINQNVSVAKTVTDLNNNTRQDNQRSPVADIQKQFIKVTAVTPEVKKEQVLHKSVVNSSQVGEVPFVKGEGMKDQGQKSFEKPVSYGQVRNAFNIEKKPGPAIFTDNTKEHGFTKGPAQIRETLSDDGFAPLSKTISLNELNRENVRPITDSRTQKTSEKAPEIKSNSQSNLVVSKITPASKDDLKKALASVLATVQKKPVDAGNIQKQSVSNQVPVAEPKDIIKSSVKSSSDIASNEVQKSIVQNTNPIEKSGTRSVTETYQKSSESFVVKSVQESISDPGVVNSAVHMVSTTTEVPQKKEDGLGEVPRDILEKVLKVD